MPGVNYPAGDFFYSKITELERRIRNLETAWTLVTVADTAGGASSTYSSTSWGAGSPAGPTVTATLGPSGKALVTLSGFIQPGSYVSGEAAYMAVSIDGSDPTGGPYAGASVTASSTQQIAGLVQYIVTLTPGQHTFVTQYKVTTASVTATYAQQSLVVQPL